MIPTLDYISDKFAHFNNVYFNGELQCPNFEIMSSKRVLGQCSVRRMPNFIGVCYKIYIIRISKYYNRSEKDICNTLLHEMIHLYIHQNDIRDTRPHHGEVFYSIAERINRQGGWHISRCDSVAGCGVNEEKSKQIYNVACFIDDKNTAFCFVMHRNYVKEYQETFERYPHHFRDVFTFQSNDHKRFANFPQCRTRMMGYSISMAEFENFKINTMNKNKALLKTA